MLPYRDPPPGERRSWWEPRDVAERAQWDRYAAMLVRDLVPWFAWLRWLRRHRGDE